MLHIENPDRDLYRRTVGATTVFDEMKSALRMKSLRDEIPLRGVDR